MGDHRVVGRKVENFGGKKVLKDNPFYVELERLRTRVHSNGDGGKFEEDFEALLGVKKELERLGREWERENTTFFTGRRLLGPKKK